MQVAHQALEELGRLRSGRMAHADFLAPIEREYRDRLRRARAVLEELHLAHDDLREDEIERTRRRLLFVEKREAIEAYREGLIDHAVYEHLMEDIDARLHALDAGHVPSEADREMGLHPTAREEGVLDGGARSPDVDGEG